MGRIKAGIELRTSSVNSFGTDMVAPLELGLCVDDLERSIAFYRDFLGFTFVSSIETSAEAAIASGFANDGYTVVRLQLPTGERLKLFKPGGILDPARARARPLSRVGFAYLTLIVADITVLMARLAAKGFPARSLTPYRLRDNVLVALIDDPDGNVVELVEYERLSDYRSDL
jgi:lactoylglutathione lyase